MHGLKVSRLAKVSCFELSQSRKYEDYFSQWFDACALATCHMQRACHETLAIHMRQQTDDTPT